MRRITSLLCVCFLWACQKNETEDLFGQSPTLRTEQKQQELLEELTSAENGWKLSYQTNDKKFGGFTFLMKFDTDFNVTMSSDFNEQTITQQKSSYLIKTGQGTMLSFVTKNHIHNLADATLGEIGKGYQGEFEFIYLGKENDKLKFRTQRGTSKEIYLEKATANENVKMSELQQHIKSLSFDSFRYLAKVTTADGTEQYWVKCDDSRYMTLKSNKNPLEEYSFGVIPTFDGLSISPAVNIKGKTFTFLENKGQRVYEGTIDNVTLQISFEERPSAVAEDYKEIGTSISGLVLIVETMENSHLISERFKKLLTTDKGRKLYAVRMYFDSGYCDLEILNEFGTGISLLRHFASYEIKDRKLYLNDNIGGYISSRDSDWEDPNNEDVLKQAMTILNLLTDENQGYYVQKQNEKIGALPNDVYVLQSDKNPNIYFPAYGVE